MPHFPLLTVGGRRADRRAVRDHRGAHSDPARQVHHARPVLDSVLFLACAQNCVALTEPAKEQHSAPTLFDLDPFFFCVCVVCGVAGADHSRKWSTFCYSAIGIDGASYLRPVGAKFLEIFPSGFTSTLTMVLFVAIPMQCGGDGLGGRTQQRAQAAAPAGLEQRRRRQRLRGTELQRGQQGQSGHCGAGARAGDRRGHPR
jgi:hypothetical protein